MKPEEEGKVQQTTQSMTPVDATQIMPKAPTAVKKNIRELNPVEIKDETVPQTGHRRKYVILAGGFLAALFLGFVFYFNIEFTKAIFNAVQLEPAAQYFETLSHVVFLS